MTLNLVYFSYRTLFPALVAAIHHRHPAASRQQVLNRARRWQEKTSYEEMSLILFDLEKNGDPALYICSVSISPAIVERILKSLDGMVNIACIPVLVGPAGVILHSPDQAWAEARVAVERARLELERRP